MRAAVSVLVLALSGCDLYFGNDAPDASPGDGGGAGVCPGGPVDNPPLEPGTVRRATRLATASNEFAWDVARTSDNAIFVVGELDGGGGQGQIACFEPDGTLAWTVFDSTVLRWRAVVVDDQGAPIVVGDLRSGGSVVRRLQLPGDGRNPWSINLSAPTGAVHATAIASALGGIELLIAGELTGTMPLGDATPVSNGGSDGIFIRIENAFGVIRSTFAFGGTGDDALTGIAVRGNQIAASGHSRSASFDLAGRPHVGAGGQDALVFRSDVAGNVTWARRVGGAGDEAGASVALDEAGVTFLMTDHAIIAHDIIGQELWVTALDSPVVSSLWDLGAAGGKVYTAGMYFAPGTLGGVALPEPNNAPRFVAELAADTGAPGWIVAGEGPTIDAALEVGTNLLVAGTYLVNFEMGGVRLDPSTPHDIYAMEIAR